MLFLRILGTCPRQALAGEAIVLSEKSIKAVSLPNKSVRHQEAFQNDIICYSGGNITIPGEPQRHRPCAKLHHGLRKRADVFCQQTQTTLFSTPPSPPASTPFFVLFGSYVPQKRAGAGISITNLFLPIFYYTSSVGLSFTYPLKVPFQGHVQCAMILSQPSPSLACQQHLIPPSLCQECINCRPNQPPDLSGGKEYRFISHL